MKRLRLLLYLFVVMISRLAMGQMCVNTPPGGPFTHYGYLSGAYGNVPLGISVIQLYSGYGAGSEVQASFTASLDACTDPDFHLLGTQCTSSGGGQSCYAAVAFLPTKTGYHSGVLYGQINLIYPPEYMIPPVHELDTVYLGGTGYAPIAPDLSVTSLTVDGTSPLPVDQPTAVKVVVAGSNLNNLRAQSAIVTLTAGSQSLTQTVPVETLYAGMTTLTFDLKFNAEDAGHQILTAHIEVPGASEVVLDNNTMTIEVEVGEKCPVEPLTPITDPDALRFEAANGNIVDLNLDPALDRGRLCLDRRLTILGQNPVTTSGYRPSQYQIHLRNVWDKSEELKKNSLAACNQLKIDVAQKLLRHNIVRQPAFGSRHAAIPAEAFDLSWGRIVAGRRTRPTNLPRGVTIDNLARRCNLHRPVSDDPVHFEVRP